MSISTAEKLHVRRVVPEATLPTRAHPDDAGLDLYALENGAIAPGEGYVARTGIAFSLPPKTVGMVADRSSMAKRGFKTSGGVIDAGYRGEVHIVLRNITTHDIRFEKGERIAQMIIIPIVTPAVVEVDALDETHRGTKGFGSTGR